MPNDNAPCKQMPVHIITVLTSNLKPGQELSSWCLLNTLQCLQEQVKVVDRKRIELWVCKLGYFVSDGNSTIGSTAILDTSDRIG